MVPMGYQFPESGNIVIQENAILRQAVAQLRGRLPSGWEVELDLWEPEEAGPGADAVLRLKSPDGKTAELVVEVKQRLDPRGALVVAQQHLVVSDSRPSLVVTRWVSAATRERLVEAGLNFIDLTGNARIVLSVPGLFIEATGSAHDPAPETRRATLKGVAAARVVRALCRVPLPVGVRALAASARATPGYVSKILSMLDREAVVCRSEEGRVTQVDLARLLQRWAADAPLTSRAAVSSWIDARGLPAFLAKLAKAPIRYAVTGSLVAARKAPVAASRLAMVYTDDPEALAQALGLRPAEAGANVLLLLPEDDLVFRDTWLEEGICCAALPQVAADLLSSPGRGPAEAEALLGWLSEHREARDG